MSILRTTTKHCNNLSSEKSTARWQMNSGNAAVHWLECVILKANKSIQNKASTLLLLSRRSTCVSQVFLNISCSANFDSISTLTML